MVDLSAPVNSLFLDSFVVGSIREVRYKSVICNNEMAERDTAFRLFYRRRAPGTAISRQYICAQSRFNNRLSGRGA